MSDKAVKALALFAAVQAASLNQFLEVLSLRFFRRWR
jgi:hypothetical protein